MINVSKSQSNHIEYLIEQSMRGHHVLFETSDLRRVFGPKKTKSRLLTESEASVIEPILERLIQEPTLERKRALLEGLDRRTFESIVRTYFCIVENNLFESLEVHH